VDTILTGKLVRLEPLEQRHAAGLAAASAVDPSLYQWSSVPQGIAAATEYIARAASWRDAGTAAPFAIVRLQMVVIGSTRLWDREGRGRPRVPP